MRDITFPIRVLSHLGVDTLIGREVARYTCRTGCLFQSATNAAGGLNPDYRVRDIVIINDV